MKTLLTLLLLSLISSNVLAAQLTLYGARPFVSLTKGLSPRWDLNVFYAETVNESNTVFGRQHFVPRDVQSYFQTGLTYKQSQTINYTAGYVFQRNNPLYPDFSNENRLWQQAIVSHRLITLALSHRFRFEERFIENRGTKHTDKMATRLRYQFSFTAALEGKEVDPSEFYLTAYNESYLSLSGQRNALYSENWTYAGVGYQTQSLGKLEIGPLVQWAKINPTGDTRLFYLLQLGWSYTL